MSDYPLSSLLLSLQHHEQSLHGIERHLINQIERAEAEGLITDEKLRAFSSALEQLLSIRTSFHDRLAELSDSLGSEEHQTLPLPEASREEERVETYAPFQTSPGLTPNALTPPMSSSELKADETPALHIEAEGSPEGGELLGEAPTLEPMQSPFSLTQPSVKLQEALSKGTTSLDDRLPHPQPSFATPSATPSGIVASSSPQPSVLPPLMQTPLPVALKSEEALAQEPIAPHEPTPSPQERSEALTLTEEELNESSPASEPTPEELQARADNPYITYVPPTPEPVISEESGGHFEPISDLNFNADPGALDDLDLEDLERSLDQLGAGELEAEALPSLSGAGSQAQEASVKRPPRVSLGVRVEVASDVVRFEAMGHDISAGGIFIETDTPLEPGEQLRLRFELDRTAYVVEVTAQVRWCRLAKDAGPDRPVGGGLRFLNLSEQASAEIAAFTAERLGGGI